MRIEITIDGADAAGANYIGWAPVHSSMRLVEADEGTKFVNVLLQNQTPDQGGQVVFSCAFAGDPERDARTNRIVALRRHDRLHLRLPANGNAVGFFIAGQFGRPSTKDKDAVIEVVEANTGAVLAAKALMVRIRKNADNLTADERDRFLSALAVLNGGGRGKFSAFRDVHRDNTSDEAHTYPAFPHWHRSYLLDLERELQQIDPTVALPYWKFDEPAENVFRLNFMGVADLSIPPHPDEQPPPDKPPVNPAVRFGPLNPLQSWNTDGKLGIDRSPNFDPINTAPFGVSNNEEETLLLGGLKNLYAPLLKTMELDPHGAAHVSFAVGYIRDIDTAARDPLFFMLHANVDRLWAKWQWFYWRFSTEDPAAYHPRPNRIGHYLKDTMWPWNQVTTRPRPVTAPGGTLAASPTVNAPGPMPTVGDMMDYQGVIDPGNRLGFDYDDVPFEFPLEVGPAEEEPFV